MFAIAVERPMWLTMVDAMVSNQSGTN